MMELALFSLTNPMRGATKRNTLPTPAPGRRRVSSRPREPIFVELRSKIVLAACFWRSPMIFIDSYLSSRTRAPQKKS